MSSTRVDAAQNVVEEFDVSIISALSGNSVCSFRAPADTEVLKVKRFIGADQGINVFQQYLFVLHGSWVCTPDSVAAAHASICCSGSRA